MRPRFILLLFMLVALYVKLPAQEVALKVENVNVLYRHVENPVMVVIEKKPIRNIVVKAQNGTLRPDTKPCLYYYYTDDCSLKEEKIYVGLKTGKGIRWLDTTSYRVLSALPPALIVSCKSTGVTWKEKLLERPDLQLRMVEFLVNPTPKYAIDTFSVEVLRNDSLIYHEYNVAGNSFSPELIRFISDADPGYTLEFFVISWRSLSYGPVNGCRGEIAPVRIRVEKDEK